MAFATKPCPLGKELEKECNGTQQKNKDNLIFNACAACQKAKERIMQDNPVD